MRKSKILIALSLLSALLLQGCVDPSLFAKDGTEGTQTVSPVEDGAWEETPDVSYEYDANINEAVLDTGLDERYLMLANKVYPLGSDYEPAELVTLECNTTYQMELEARAAAALYEMLAEMRADGLDVDNDADDGKKGYDLAVTSAYRSYLHQKELFEEYVAYERDHPEGFSSDAYAVLGHSYIKKQYTDRGLDRLSVEDARRVVLSYSAEAGKSEHQTGLCVDFISEDMKDNLTTVFEQKPAFAWLSENAHQFGFILRYPKGKENITGYTYEPWHYRFVGREAAIEIWKNGWTLEEYLGRVGVG